MSEVWAALGKAKLQQLIGHEIIDRLEILLPGLRKDTDSSSLHQMDGLVAVFNAFFGGDALRKAKFRAELFDALPPKTVSALASAAKLDENLPFEKKVQSLAKRGWDDPEFRVRAGEILHLAPEYFPESPKIFCPEEILRPLASLYKPLKDYQFSVFSQAESRLRNANSRFVIQMPTGSGKTRTAMELICAFLNEKPNGTVVVWLAHSEELCQQAADSFAEVWPHVALRGLRLIRFWGPAASLPYEFPESAFVVAGFAKLHALIKRDTIGFRELQARVQFVIVDEAHKVTAPTYAEVTKALRGEETRIVGLTATPGRSITNSEENAALASFFFNQLITIDSKGQSVISFLRQRGVLSHVEYEPLYTHREYSLSNHEKRHMEQFFDLPPGFLSTLGLDDVRNVEIVKKLESEASKGRRILFFACSVEHSKFICALLKFLEVSAEHIDGTTPTEQRSAHIRKFKTGEVQVLCNFGVLSTGFDAPKTDLIFIARPTASIVLYSQMIGRGLRGPAIGGTEHCKIVDVIDNISGFSNEDRVYSYFDEYYDDRG